MLWNMVNPEKMPTNSIAKARTLSPTMTNSLTDKGSAEDETRKGEKR